MEPAKKEKLKKAGIISAIFLFFILLLWAVQLLNFLSENSLKKSAKKILQSSPLCTEYKDLEIQKAEKRYYYNYGFLPITFKAHGDGGTYKLFFVRLAGKYGAYQGLFLHQDGENTVFCGLAGTDNSKPAEYYGITEFNIRFWCGKINSVFNCKKNVSK